MLKVSKGIKITLYILAVLVIMTLLALCVYLEILPRCVSNQKIINYAESMTEKFLHADIEITKPVLKTSIKPKIYFSLEEFSIGKNNTMLLSVKNIDMALDLSKIFKKRLIVDKLGADYIFADVDKLTALFPKSTEEQKPFEWKIDMFNSLLYVKKCIVNYDFSKDTKIKLNADNLEITSSRNPKFVRFDIDLDIIKNNKILSFNIKDDNKVYVNNRKLYIDNCMLAVNKSKMYIKSVSDEDNNFDFTVYAKKFDIINVVELIETNFILPNGDEMLAFFKDISGNFDFDVNITNKGIKGVINLNQGKLTLIPLNDLKLSFNSGKVEITPDIITLSDIKGHYNSNRDNKVEIKGTIKDYFKSFDTYILVDALATKEFSTKHLSKVVGYPLEIVGKAKSKIVYKSHYNNIDVGCLFLLKKGEDILVDGQSLSPVNYDRAVAVDMGFTDNIINIKYIDYYIASTIDRNSKIKPILSIRGNVDAITGTVKNIGFTIPKPLPSEFLNVLIGQKIFKKGTIAGNMEYVNNEKIPYLKADMSIDKVRVPSQRLFIKQAKLNARDKKISLSAAGKYKRSDYKLTGEILNELIFPVIVKDIDLTVDNIDIAKMLNSFNSQNVQTSKDAPAAEQMQIATKAQASGDDDDAVTFNTGLLIVEKCALNVIKGAYKDINFGNLKAELTLDKNGILNVKSNRFDIAEGISSCKVYCDLVKHKYSLVLGVKDINSDIMATSLLDLKKEISGKASGIISLNTDDSLLLNGYMKFIVKNGTIGKIGLIEYVLKFAALFRNPVAMISPSTFVDLVNIPEGNFDKITGDLSIKDNVIEKIIIKSSAPQLSSLIVGRFDLGTRDATLRIYTKFSDKNKGMSGALRNLSLNSLANRVPMGSRNDSNYYAAELEHLPAIDADERDCQVFLTKVDGDVEHNNFISSLKKIK